MPGRLTVIGLGPGSAGLLAPMALASLARAGAVVGYDRYMALVDPALLHGKALFREKNEENWYVTGLRDPGAWSCAKAERIRAHCEGRQYAR